MDIQPGRNQSEDSCGNADSSFHAAESWPDERSFSPARWAEGFVYASVHAGASINTERTGIVSQ